MPLSVAPRLLAFLVGPFVLGSSTLVPALVSAEEAPEPPPVDDAPASAPSTPRAAPAEEPADPYAGDPALASPNGGAATATAATDAGAAGTAGAGAAVTEGETEFERYARVVSLREGNTLSGSTGTMRVRGASSGRQGTFRFNVNGGFNGMSGFLCTTEHPCPDSTGFLTTTPDDSSRIEALATLSVTPLSFLEVFAGIKNSSTSNSRGTPELLQILGDWNLGVKGFLPKKPDRIFTFGGEMELLLLTGTGGVGLDGAATSFAMRGLATADLSYRSEKSKRLPLRFNANLGYFFDNSGAVVFDLEETPPPAGRGTPIQRTERYGLGISRVDSFEIGLSAEYLNEWVHPFIEWTIDVPVNRQGYVCNVDDAARRGDLCLGNYAGMQTSPSRFSLGARGYPWQETGLTVTLAIDIGTGATGFFLEEVTPEAPYTIWFGLGYAVDVNPPPPPKAVVVAAAATALPEARRYVFGRVLDDKSMAPVPGAIVRYPDDSFTGMITSADGTFTTTDLAPGTYEFAVTAPDFRDGTCTVVVPDTAAAAPTASQDPALVDPFADDAASNGDLDRVHEESSEGAAPYLDEEGNVIVPVDCALKATPQVASIVGLVVDQDTGAAVPDSTITITDKLDRRLELAVDERGSYQFRNVPFGVARLTVRAPGYLPTVRELKLESRKEVEANIVMNKLPARSSVVATAKALVLRKPIGFIGETTEVAADSMIVVEEVALLLTQNEDLGPVSIQVHSDDVGDPNENRRLSQARAERLRSQLALLGVGESRLTAKGLGPDQPLVPNLNEENRKKNRRVEFVLVPKTE